MKFLIHNEDIIMEPIFFRSYDIYPVNTSYNMVRFQNEFAMLVVFY